MGVVLRSWPQSIGAISPVLMDGWLVAAMHDSFRTRPIGSGSGAIFLFTPASSAASSAASSGCWCRQ